MIALEQVVPEGYKTTDVGVIPNDWKASILGDFVRSLEAGISVNSVDKREAFSHGKHILKTSCVSKGYFYPKEAKSIIPIDINRAKTIPIEGAIIVSRMNTPDLVGELGFIDETYSDLFLPDRLWQMRFRSSAKTNTRWLAYILSFPAIAQKIKESATGTSNSMKNISKGSLLSITFPAPEFEEQTAIANALSDVDALLTELENLIAKKQAIKTATMQQLLTGKTRLPQFATYTEGAVEGKRKGVKSSDLGEIPEDWDVVCINEIATLIGDGIHSTPTYDSNGDYYFVNGNNIHRGKLKLTENTNKVSEAEFKKHKKNINERTLFLSINGTIGNLAYYKNEPIILGKSAAFINIKTSTNLEYAYHMLSHEETQQRFEDGLTGSTIKNLGLGTIKSTLIPIPKLEEQTAIATILSDMDNEIQTLEQRLAKTRQIKQGMMQQLLTGRTRLPFKQAKEA